MSCRRIVPVGSCILFKYSGGARSSSVSGYRLFVHPIGSAMIHFPDDDTLKMLAREAGIEGLEITTRHTGERLAWGVYVKIPKNLGQPARSKFLRLVIKNLPKQLESTPAL